jgi:hypothetical protein
VPNIDGNKFLLEALLQKKVNEEKIAEMIEKQIREDSAFQRRNLRKQMEEKMKDAHVLLVKLNSCRDSSIESMFSGESR